MKFKTALHLALLSAQCGMLVHAVEGARPPAGLAPAPSAADGAAVQLREEPIIIPTYPLGAPDKNPIFYSGRRYQGAQGPVYPYPLLDKLGEVRVDQTYQAVCLENKYLQLTVLPELGGRIFSGLDKTDNYDFFYRQHVIKPALIGMAGAWISGGVEWNIPHHHRVTTFMPVDYRLVVNPDGSKTVWVGETEWRQRMHWVVGLTLYPDRSYLEVTTKLFNRTPFAHSMLCFANAAVHAGPDYQVIFPPGTEFGTQHAKREFVHWPIGQEVYNKLDHHGIDLSWWKNQPSPVSIFAWNYADDFVGGYDHGKLAGVVHVADHHVVPGKKFFTWGHGAEGQMWDKVLTEQDGPYIELMTGAYSDNQPDYSWVQPYETRMVKEYWYPLRSLGGVKQANRDAAINLDVDAGRTVRLAVNTTREFRDARVVLQAAGKTIFEQKTMIGPAQPFSAQLPLGSDGSVADLRLAVWADGQELISYQPAQSRGTPLPAPVMPPSAPQELPSNEELYLAGLRLEQFHNPSINPVLYYEEALKRDPTDSRVNTAVGLLYCKRGLFAKAEQRLRVAIEKITRRYTRPEDTEALYYLGVALRGQGKYADADEALHRAAWGYAWSAASYYALAEDACRRGDYAGALEFLESSLATGALNTKAWALKAMVLRKLDRIPDALAAIREAQRLDPLDCWSQHEAVLIATGSETPADTLSARRSLASLMRGNAEAYMELAADYAAGGAWDEASEVLTGFVDAAADKSRMHPMVFYDLAFYADQKQEQAKARHYRELAGQLPRDYCFPFRLESIDVLESAIAANPGDARALYYLGNLLYDIQPQRAMVAWEQSRKLDPQFATVQRNLGFAYAHVEGDFAKAAACLNAAVACDPTDPRLFTELDQVSESAGVDPAQRLAVLEKNATTVARRDDALLRAVGLHILLGHYDRALSLLAGHHFRRWEGESVPHDMYVDAHLLRGQQQLTAQHFTDALQDFRAALEFPENFEIGRPQDGGEKAAQIHYLIGAALEGTGQKAAARSQFEQALSAKRGLLPMHYYVALAYGKLGNAIAAQRILDDLICSGTEALKRIPRADFFGIFGTTQSSAGQAAEAHYLIGLGLLGQGDQVGARAELQKVVQLNPHQLEALTFLGTTSVVAAGKPRINGAKIFGVRPGRPILYTIAATGQRPMRFSAIGLPHGVQLDEQTGQLSGSLADRGTYRIMLRAGNTLGQAERELRLVVGDEIALTPPMGCNTYGGWGPFVTEANIRAAADALVQKGLIQHGYCFVNIDDGWQGKRSGKDGAIQPNEKFGDLHVLCNDLHRLGLKAGIYSTPWTTSYEGFVGGSSDNAAGFWERPTPHTKGWRHGKFRFEANDARQIAEWGFDYFKYDWGIDRVEFAQAMGDALRGCDRDIVFELSNSAPLAQAAEFTRIGTMTRTAGDLVDVWDRSQLDEGKRKWALGIRDLWLEHKTWQPFSRPGHWNMPCPLRVGLLGGWDRKPLQPTRLTPDEQYAHISLWCLWSAPLIIGCPPERLDEFTLSLLTNDEVLEVDQDPLGRQARPIEVAHGEVLIKDLEDGSKALGLFNAGATNAEVSVTWSELGLPGAQAVRDLWRRKDLGTFADGLAVAVPSHGVVLVKISPAVNK